MKTALFLLGMLAALGMLSKTEAANLMKGKERAQACGACHGKNGVSVSADIPNLAGQKVEYLTTQLKAFKAGKRKNLIMNAIASQLNETEIQDLAAFWNSLPGAAGTAQSAMPAEIVKTRVGFPKNYQKEFTHYTTINFEAKKQVRKYFANGPALKAARDGKPLPNGSVLFVEVYKAKLDGGKMPTMGTDGFYVPGKLVAYTAMEMQPGWGKDIPDLYRNGDWNYAVFTSKKALKPGVNQAKCFACHVPLASDSYVFSIKPLREKARMGQ